MVKVYEISANLYPEWLIIPGGGNKCYGGYSESLGEIFFPLLFFVCCFRI